MEFIRNVIYSLFPGRAEVVYHCKRAARLEAINKRLDQELRTAQRELQARTPKATLLKSLYDTQEALKEARAAHHVRNQRQDLLIRRLRTAVPEEVFKAHCHAINAMTDEEVIDATSRKQKRAIA